MANITEQRHRTVGFSAMNTLHVALGLTFTGSALTRDRLHRTRQMGQIFTLLYCLDWSTNERCLRPMEVGKHDIALRSLFRLTENG